MNPNVDEAEPDAGSVHAAVLSGARLWTAFALAAPGALAFATASLLDDAQAARELRDCSHWLHDSANTLPASEVIPRLLRLLSLSSSLDALH